jgi:peptidylglycine monooxygenase
LQVILGETRFAVERGWGRPSGGGYGLLSQVAVGADRRIYVLQRDPPAILVMDTDGEHANVWGADSLADPHGITAFPDGRIAAVDRDAHEILLFEPDGRVGATLGTRHTPHFREPFNHPAAIAIAPDGEMIVADGYANTRIHRFDGSGRHLQSFGEPGRGPGQFSTPHAVIVDGRDRLIVADRENDRLQIFSRDGTLLEIWDDVYRPMDLAIDGAGRLLVTDQVPRVSLFDLDGTLLGRARPILNGAHGIDIALDGTVYLCEMVPSRITRLLPT